MTSGWRETDLLISLFDREGVLEKKYRMGRNRK